MVAWGGVKINVPDCKIHTGMIRLGGYGVNLYPNNGIYINNRGVITFNGSCVIGNNSFISVAKTGRRLSLVMVLGVLLL